MVPRPLQKLGGNSPVMSTIHHSEIARDLGFDAAGLLHTRSIDDLILFTSFGRLCQAMSDHLGHV